jgi:hypothetical protein
MIVKFGAAELKGRLAGQTAGTTFPRPFQDVDARHVALETLKTYFSLLIFTRPGAVGEDPIEYSIPRSSIETEWPGETKNGDMPFPGIGFNGGEGEHETYGLGPPELIEASADVYGPGTVLIALAEYNEELMIEVWADSRAQRRSIVAGMLEAFMPLQDTSSLRLKLPDYYDRVARFCYVGPRYVDDPEVVRGRWRAQLRVELTVPEVALVGYVRQTTLAEVTVEDGQAKAQAELAAEILAAMGVQ